MKRTIILGALFAGLLAGCDDKNHAPVTQPSQGGPDPVPVTVYCNPKCLDSVLADAPLCQSAKDPCWLIEHAE